MEGIRMWIAELSAVTLIMAVISAMAPKNSAGRVCTMLGCIMLISVIISPIKNKEASEILLLGKEYENQINASIESTAIKCEEIEKEIIEERLSAYVLNKAEVNTEENKVKIEVENGIPVFATVVSSDLPSQKRICEVLENDIGLSPDKQKTEVK